MAPLIPIAMQLAQFFPGIIKLLTGSERAGEVASHVVAIANTVTGTSEPAAAVAAIQADPQKLMEFQLAMGRQQHDLEQMYLVDTQDARNRDVELAKAGMRNYRASALAAGAALLVVACLAVIVWKSGLDEFAKGAITLILGRSLGWIEQIFSFEFGTTRASKTKDDTINNLTR